jgi:isopentenyldiphosphate isomerase
VRRRGTGPADELLDLVDDEDRVIGTAPRSRVRAENLLHRGVGILVYNGRGELYVHRRTETKDVFPGLYDMFVGGTVGSGETYEWAARREVAEELGVHGAEPEYLFTYRYEGPLNRCFTRIYRVVYDGPIRHQPEEVAWGRFYPFDEVIDLLDRREFVPDGEEIFRVFVERERPPG